MENRSSISQQTYFIDVNAQNIFKFSVVKCDDFMKDPSLKKILEMMTPVFWNMSKRDMFHLINGLKDDRKGVLHFDSNRKYDWEETEEYISKSVIPLTKQYSLSFQLKTLPFLNPAMIHRMNRDIDYETGTSLAYLLKVFLSKERAIELSQYIENNMRLIDHRLMGDWLKENKHRFS